MDTLSELAAGLAKAVYKDEAPEEGGFDLSAGMFGRNVSDWLRAVAGEIARYRWLRQELQPVAGPAAYGPRGGGALFGDDLDKAIDAALAASLPHVKGAAP